MVGSKANTLRMQKIRAAKKDTERAAKEADKLRRRQQHLLAKEGELSVQY